MIQLKRTKTKPLIVTVVQVGLILNLISAAFIFLGLLGDAVYQGYKNEFGNRPIILAVALLSSPKNTTEVKAQQVIQVESNNSGEAGFDLPFWASLLVPIPFIQVWEVSVLNLLFYLVVYFSLYRILITISRDGPFLEENKSRLFWLGGLFVTWGVSLLIRNAWLDSVVRKISDNKLSFDGHSITNYIETGLVVFIIAIIYQRIVVLQKEAELVI